MSASSGIDRVLGWLKWPIAIVALVFLPGVFYALAFVARDVARRPAQIVPLAAGAAVFTLLWLALLLPKPPRHRVVTLEHELTHTLFALITLHRVSGVRAALAGGGHVRYAGRGNWLIAIAPFVVPTFTLLAIALAGWVHSPRALSAIIGFTLAWNLIGNWAPAHRHHGDHREAGRLFSFLFVTCANALLLGLALAYATQARSVTGHLDHVKGPTSAFFAWLVKVLGPG
jgi:Peptidase M50B-like